MSLPFFGRTKQIVQRIKEHLGCEPSSLPILSEQFEVWNHPNLHLALQDYTSRPGRSAKLIGIQGGILNFGGISLAEIVTPKTMAGFAGLGGAKEGPVQYTNVDLADGQKLACVQGALFLVSGTPKIVFLMRPDGMKFAGGGGTTLDILATDKAAAETAMADIRKAVNDHNIYRGKILSMSKQETPGGMPTAGGIKFHSVPAIERNKIILPEGLLKRIERQSIDVGQYSTALRNAKRKMKRGILLHGKPGTGKTLTAMYLASAMSDRTVLLVTGNGLGLIESSCAIARWLQPSMVIIEDVDLIAEERTTTSSSGHALMFELLNQMDGLNDDCDVLFMLTTNRPEVLEPALASRPGRIDQAYEIPLPDSECRRRLFNLYAEGMTVELEHLDSYIKRTAGASGAFISELMRKAALFAAPDGDPIVVKDRHMDEAMHELVVAGGSLTKNLLGFKDIGFSLGDNSQ